MTRAWWVVTVVLMGGTLAMGCGSSTSAAPSTTTAPKTFTGTPLAWLTTVARPWNKTLNDDQANVILASRAGSKTDASVFFTHLASACTRLQSDARKARMVQAAPSAVLESDWRAMASGTGAYAASCLTLSRTHAVADLTRMNDSLKAMDSANAALNAQVASVRGTGGPTAG